MNQDEYKKVFEFLDKNEVTDPEKRKKLIAYIDSKAKDITTGKFIAFFFPGFHRFYYGKIADGLLQVLFFNWMVGCVAVLLSALIHPAIIFLGVLLYPVWNVYSVNKINEDYLESKMKEAMLYL